LTSFNDVKEDKMSFVPQIKSMPKFVSVRQLVESGQYPWLTISALRHLIFRADPYYNSAGEKFGGNGLAPAIIRVGRRVLIDVERFDAWIISHQVNIDGPESTWIK
jgi:hypothetical protein